MTFNKGILDIAKQSGAQVNVSGPIPSSSGKEFISFTPANFELFIRTLVSGVQARQINMIKDHERLHGSDIPSWILVEDLGSLLDT